MRDISDPGHPLDVCSFDLFAPGMIRFVTATTFSVATQDLLYELDLRTGQMKTFVSLTKAAPMDSYDVSADGLSVAYVLFADPEYPAQSRMATLHLMVNGTDRTLATVRSPSFSASDTHVEFAPSGKSVAFGASAVTGVKEGAPIQVWSLDGHLMFSSPGNKSRPENVAASASVTWAGTGDHLFFDDGTNLNRWDGTGNSSLVLAGRWRYPSTSTDRQYVAYEGTEGKVAVISTANGAITHLPGNNVEPAFMTSTLVLYGHYLCPNGRCGPGGPNEERMHNMADATDVVSQIAGAFSTWPKSTPPHG